MAKAEANVSEWQQAHEIPSTVLCVVMLSATQYNPVIQAVYQHLMIQSKQKEVVSTASM